MAEKLCPCAAHVVAAATDSVRADAATAAAAIAAIATADGSAVVAAAVTLVAGGD